MGKLLYKILHGILPSWITKIKISDGSPKKLPFFRGRIRGSLFSKSFSSQQSEAITESNSSVFGTPDETRRASAADQASTEEAVELESVAYTAGSMSELEEEEEEEEEEGQVEEEVESVYRSAIRNSSHSKRKSDCLKDASLEEASSSNSSSRFSLKRRRKSCRKSGTATCADLPISLREVVGDSSAVVTYSNDPHQELWESMVEMIVGNGLWEPGNLECLLYCYLSLNDPQLHGLIEKTFIRVLRDLERTQ